MQKKKGISLIVLVITIIVMIILAATIMIALSNNGVLGRAEEAVDVLFFAVDMSKITLAGKCSRELKQLTANTGENADQVTIVD